MSTKAFTLVSAVEWELLAGDKERVHIECVECCGKNLYVGTSDCIVYHFLLEERVLPTGTATFSATKQLHRHLGFRKPVNELRAASALNRLLVLCDNSITLVNMMSLEPVPSGGAHQRGHGAGLEREPREWGPILRGSLHHLGQAQDHPAVPGVRGPGSNRQGGVHAGTAPGRGRGRPLPVPGSDHTVHHTELQHRLLPGPVSLLQRGEAPHRQEDRETGVPPGRSRRTG